jgi:hypothetical protein
MTTQSMRIACWISKAINTLSEYVITCSFSTATSLACYLVFTLPFLLFRIRDKNSTGCAETFHSSVSQYVVTVDNPQLTCGIAGFLPRAELGLRNSFTLSW